MFGLGKHKHHGMSMHHHLMYPGKGIHEYGHSKKYKKQVKKIFS